LSRRGGATSSPIDATVALGHRFVDAIVAHDWDGVAACFAPEAEFRAADANGARVRFRSRSLHVDAADDLLQASLE